MTTDLNQRLRWNTRFGRIASGTDGPYPHNAQRCGFVRKRCPGATAKSANERAATDGIGFTKVNIWLTVLDLEIKRPHTRVMWLEVEFRTYLAPPISAHDE